MGSIRIALQLYSVRDDCARDLSGTLETVADIGYEGVEFAGYYGRSAGELRDLLDGLGLAVAGSHISIDSLLGGRRSITICFNRVLGNKYLIVPGLPEHMRGSKAAWIRVARVFNEIAERLKPEGMRVGYHNHMVEFRPIDGETAWDVFFSSTTPEVVMQLDVGNAMRGGLSIEDVFDVIRRYPGRLKTIHLKEFSRVNEKALIGEGEVDWPELIDLCRRIGGTEWFIVEQETYPYPPLESVKRCLANLRDMLGL